jgi:hypothetical protein
VQHQSTKSANKITKILMFSHPILQLDELTDSSGHGPLAILLHLVPLYFPSHFHSYPASINGASDRLDAASPNGSEASRSTSFTALAMQRLKGQERPRDTWETHGLELQKKSLFNFMENEPFAKHLLIHFQGQSACIGHVPQLGAMKLEVSLRRSDHLHHLLINTCCFRVNNLPWLPNAEAIELDTGAREQRDEDRHERTCLSAGDTR